MPDIVTAPARRLVDQHGKPVAIPAGSPAAALLDPSTHRRTR